MKKLFSQTKPEFLLAMALVVVGISTRLLFYWLGIHNFNALTASVLFAGAYLQRSKWAYAIPLVMLLVTDAVIGFYDAGQMSVVYVSYALTLLIGMLYAKKPSLLAFAGVTLGGTAVFFLVSNFALWPFYNQYPHTFDGIIESYTLALPFVKNSLMSNMLFSAILFGSFEMAKVAVTKKVALAN
jgi:hypothetical protein